jgi:hypothetical protein
LARTQAKFAFSGTDYMESLLQDMSIENIPARFGGQFQLYNEPLEFDVSEGGALHYPGAETDSLVYSPRVKQFQQEYFANEQVDNGDINKSVNDERQLNQPIQKIASNQTRSKQSNKSSMSTYFQHFIQFFQYNWTNNPLQLTLGFLSLICLMMKNPIIVQAIFLALVICCYLFY